MASMNYEVDQIGGGLGGIGGFGGGYGIVILLLLFFAIFSNGGLFGRRDGHDGHNYGILDDVRGRGPSSCEIEKELLVGNSKIIENQNCIYEKQQNAMLYDAKLKISQLETEKYIGAAITGAIHPVNDKLCWLENHVAIKPEVFARADVQCLQPIPGCGDRRDFC